MSRILDRPVRLGAMIAAVFVPVAVLAVGCWSAGDEATAGGRVLEGTGVDGVLSVCTDQGHRLYMVPEVGALAAIADPACAPAAGS